MGMDSSRLTELCSLPLAQSAKDRCKSPNSFQFGLEMRDVLDWMTECLKDARPARDCHESLLRRYGALLEKHGGALPVPLEPQVPGTPGDFVMAQMLADVVKLYGHPCPSISSFSLDDRRLTCNHGEQAYLLGNRSGRLVVVVE